MFARTSQNRSRRDVVDVASARVLLSGEKAPTAAIGSVSRPTACGCAVLEASDGPEALRVAQRYRGRIDLLVADVVLPKMGGCEVAARLTALRPGLRVLYLSGHTEDAVAQHGVLAQEVAFLQKPFAALALAQKVREALGEQIA